ncbi:hypothetical protein CsSME_00022164 [Camellia sinensis var. sinensis]
MSMESPQFTKGVSSRAKDVVRDSKSPVLFGLGQTKSGSLSLNSRSFAAFMEGLRSEIVAMDALGPDERGSTRGRVSNRGSNVVISQSQAIKDLWARLNTICLQIGWGFRGRIWYPLNLLKRKYPLLHFSVQPASD